MPALPPDSLLHRLDFALRQRLEGYLEGDAYAYGVRGGLELEQVRPWTPGDDWRLLEVAATARTNEPHVKVPIAERRLRLWLGIDVSSSMAFGTTTWEKAELAVSVGAVFGLIALRQGGLVGAMALGTGDEVPSPPRASRPALLGLLEGMDAQRWNVRGDLADCLSRLDRVVRNRSVVIIISDFSDTQSEWFDPLARLSFRHEVICAQVWDPREFELANTGVVRFIDPETSNTFTVDTASKKLRTNFAERAAARQASVEHAIKASGADLMRISTESEWLDSLVHQIERRRRHRWAYATQ